MPDPLKVLTTIRRATALVRSTPGRSGGIITLENATDVMVVGDLHGNIAAFKKVLALSALERFPGRHLVLQELIHGTLVYPDDKGDRRINSWMSSRPSNASIRTGCTTFWEIMSSRS